MGAKRLSKTVWPALAVSEMGLVGTAISLGFDLLLKWDWTIAASQCPLWVMSGHRDRFA